MSQYWLQTLYYSLNVAGRSNRQTDIHTNRQINKQTNLGTFRVSASVILLLADILVCLGFTTVTRETILCGIIVWRIQC